MSTFTKSFAFLVIGCSIALVGCGDKGSGTPSTATTTSTTSATPDAGKPATGVADAGLAGHYTVTMPMPASKNPNDPAEKMGQKMAEAMAKGSSLDIKADNTFAMTMMSIPMEGTWTSADKKVILTPTKIMGKTFEEMKKENPSAKVDQKPLELQVGDDGKLTAVDPSGKSQSLVFTKAAK